MNHELLAADLPVKEHVVTENSITRITKGGRSLTYTLRVIQQPEHARACGSGQKAHADRRPVDPPPVIELKIRDGEGKDVTFSYAASFFLYATLEAAPLGPGRLPPNNGMLPVMTGNPVSGMAYLDRPSPAGYFLFPDLSVRHEGCYNLNFSLYEDIKDDLDADVDAIVPCFDESFTGPMAPTERMPFRLEVKSTPFQVYSAKKFPGLCHSTILSRNMAEQGCRIRIRRDVRMRKRESKPKTDQGFEQTKTREIASYESSRRPSSENAYVPKRSIEEAAAALMATEQAHAAAAQQASKPALPEIPIPSTESNQYHAPPPSYQAPPVTNMNEYSAPAYNQPRAHAYNQTEHSRPIPAPIQTRGPENMSLMEVDPAPQYHSTPVSSTNVSAPLPSLSSLGLSSEPTSAMSWDPSPKSAGPDPIRSARYSQPSFPSQSFTFNTGYAHPSMHPDQESSHAHNMDLAMSEGNRGMKRSFEQSFGNEIQTGESSDSRNGSSLDRSTLVFKRAGGHRHSKVSYV
jgi:hypothetical protein